MGNRLGRRKISYVVATLGAVTMMAPAFLLFAPNEGLSAEFVDTANVDGSSSYPKPGDVTSGNTDVTPSSFSATRNGPNCDLSWAAPGTEYTNTRITRNLNSGYIYNSTPAPYNTVDTTAGPWSETYKLQHAVNNWSTKVTSANCPVWSISDNFNRSGSLPGSMTSSGKALWVGGNGSTNGDRATGGDASLLKYGSANAAGSLKMFDVGSSFLIRSNADASTYSALTIKKQYNVPYMETWTNRKFYNVKDRLVKAAVSYQPAKYVTWVKCGSYDYKPGWSPGQTFYANPTVYTNLDANPRLYAPVCYNSYGGAPVTRVIEETWRTKPNFTAETQKACPVEEGSSNGWSESNKTCGQWGRTKWVANTTLETTMISPEIPAQPAEYGWRTDYSYYDYPQSQQNTKTVWSTLLENYSGGALTGSTTLSSGDIYTKFVDGPSTCVNDLNASSISTTYPVSIGACSVVNQGTRSSAAIPTNYSFNASGSTLNVSDGLTSRNVPNSNTNHDVYGYYGVVGGSSGVDDFALNGATR